MPRWVFRKAARDNPLALGLFPPGPVPASPAAPPAGGPPAAPPVRRGWRWDIIAGVGFILAVGVVIVASDPGRPPDPPTVPSERLDPEVLAALTRDRDKILAAPRDPKAWGTYGMTLLAHEYGPEADECFLRAAELDPKEPRWPYFQGYRLLASDPPGSIPFFRAARDLAADTPLARTTANRLAEVFIGVGDLDGAATALSGPPGSAGPDPQRNYLLGSIALSRGDAAKARPLLETALQAAPKRANSQLAAVARRLGDEEAARKHERAAQNLPEDRSWNDPILDECYIRQVGRRRKIHDGQRLTGAERAQYFIQLADTDPDLSANELAGNALAQTGDYDRAEVYYRRCLSLDPEHPLARDFLAVRSLDRGDIEAKRGRPDAATTLFREGVEHARRSLARKPDNTQARQTLGRLLVRLGDVAEGVEQLKQAVAAHPERQEPHLALAEVQLDLGDLDGARKSLADAEAAAEGGLTGGTRAARLAALKDRLARATEPKKVP